MILVTGGTGNIGRHVVRLLLDAGERVRLMTRKPAGVTAREGLEIARGDFGDPSSWEGLFTGVSRMHLFPHVYSSGGDDFVSHAVAAGVQRIVVHSAAAAAFEAFTNPRTALALHLEEERAAHRGLEIQVERTGVDWAHVRPGLLAVNALGWAADIRVGRTLEIPYATAGYPWVHELDVAEVAVRALTDDTLTGQAWTITGPNRVTQQQQVEAIAEALGREVPMINTDPAVIRARWLSEGWPATFVEGWLAVLADALNGPGRIPPTNTVEELLGRPALDIKTWAHQHVEDFR